MTSRITFITAPEINPFGGWSRRCRIGDVEYQVAVKRGKAVKIPYKPRGQNIGWHWHGTVYSGGRCVWSGRVPKSLGVRGLLIEAGVFDE